MGSRIASRIVSGRKKMAVKIFRKDILVSTLIIVIAIFLLGLYLGFKLDTFRIDEATELLKKSELDSDSFVAESAFLEQFIGENCELGKNRVKVLSDELGEIGRTLTRYDQRKLFEKDSYKQLKRKYFILEIKSYSLLKELREKCGKENEIILFFYDVTDNEESLKQGFALDKLVNKNPKLIVFSIDREFEEPMLKTIKEFYNITKGPSIIINFEKKFERYVSEGELKEFLNEDR